MFAKIFNQIFDSSIAESPELRFTFMDLLILCDANGVVDCTHEAIARRTNRPVDVIRKTIAELEQPDPRSRTPDEGGARLKRLDDHRDWGWVIINYERFRATASEEQRKAKTAARVARFKEKQRAGRTEVTPGNAPVTPANAGNAMQRQTEMQMQKDSRVGAEEPRPASKVSKQSDDDFLKSLEADPTYAGIPVRVVDGKMRRWCEQHRKQPTRKRLVNWLNREDRPMAAISPTPPTPSTRTSAEIIP